MKAQDTYKGKTLIEWSRILAADFAAELRRKDAAGEYGSISLKEVIRQNDPCAAHDMCDANQVCIDVMEKHGIAIILYVDELPEDEQAAASAEEDIQTVLVEAMQDIASAYKYNVDRIKKARESTIRKHIEYRWDD